MSTKQQTIKADELVTLREKDFIPRNLYLRYSRRISSKYFCVYYFFVYIVMLIFGICFLNATYVTRNYIITADKFWTSYNNNSTYSSLQSYCAFTGILLTCSSLFCLMINTVVVAHIYAGGLKRRLQYSNYILFILQIILFIVAFIDLIMFKNILSLIPANFVISVFNLFSSLIYFLLIKRSLRREKLFMLSIKRMQEHAIMYKEEYLEKMQLKQVEEEPAEQ